MSNRLERVFTKDVSDAVESATVERDDRAA